ncbi:MAG: hypothetical protein GPOALKHO_001698 [Sodalis sp.]|nr:MAG: hypothetical protein GPOALKHO_001698 [Sodalis sp.]
MVELRQESIMKILIKLSWVEPLLLLAPLTLAAKNLGCRWSIPNRAQQ